MKKILKYNRNLFMWLIVITIYIYICWKLIIDVNETSIYFNLAENSKDTFNINDFEEIEKIEEMEEERPWYKEPWKVGCIVAGACIVIVAIIVISSGGGGSDTGSVSELSNMVSDNTGAVASEVISISAEHTTEIGVAVAGAAGAAFVANAKSNLDKGTDRLPIDAFGTLKNLDDNYAVIATNCKIDDSLLDSGYHFEDLKLVSSFFQKYLVDFGPQGFSFVFYFISLVFILIFFHTGFFESIFYFFPKKFYKFFNFKEGDIHLDFNFMLKRRSPIVFNSRIRFANFFYTGGKLPKLFYFLFVFFFYYIFSYSDNLKDSLEILSKKLEDIVFKEWMPNIETHNVIAGYLKKNSEIFSKNTRIAESMSAGKPALGSEGIFIAPLNTFQLISHLESNEELMKDVTFKISKYYEVVDDLCAVAPSLSVAHRESLVKFFRNVSLKSYFDFFIKFFEISKKIGRIDDFFKIFFDFLEDTSIFSKSGLIRDMENITYNKDLELGPFYAANLEGLKRTKQAFLGSLKMFYLEENEVFIKVVTALFIEDLGSDQDKNNLFVTTFINYFLNCYQIGDIKHLIKLLSKIDKKNYKEVFESIIVNRNT